MGLLDGSGAALMAGVFGGIYLDAQLYRPADTPNDKGGGTAGWGEPEEVKVQMESATEAMRQAQGYTDQDVRFLMLAQGVARPDSECQIGFDGKRYAITAPVGRDPCGAYWDIAGRPVGDDGS